MDTSPESRREHPNTYVVQDRSNEEELTRLRFQDELITTSMGGVFSEQPDSTSFKRVLDVGCGSGGWLIEVAKKYPETSSLIGVDVSGKMLDYARMQAREQGFADRIEFRTMDALRMLEFPRDYFDLINQRFGMSYLRTWDWPNLLQEFQRVSEPGGTIRLTESDMLESNTPAFSRLYDFLLQSLNNAGHFFLPERDGVTRQLEQVLHQSGIQDVQKRAYNLQYRAGTPDGSLLAKDVQHGFRTHVPFFRKWTKLPKDYGEIYQRALEEMQQPDFVATWRLLTVWGTVPMEKVRTIPTTEHR